MARVVTGFINRKRSSEDQTAISFWTVEITFFQKVMLCVRDVENCYGDSALTRITVSMV